jgi:PAS domain S-box-containing protein
MALETPRATAAGTQSGRIGMRTALVVDDHEENRYLLQSLLRGSGYDVVTATDGGEALALARLSAPDIVISDILMPGIDGFTLCREWRQDERLKGIPFVFYTATYTHPKDEEFALSLGADLFIIKPAEPDSFLRMIAEVLSLQRAGALRKPASEAGFPLATETVYLKEYNETLIRKLERKLEQLEEANKSLAIKDCAIASSISGIAIADLAERITYVNGAMARMWGLNEAEPLRIGLSDLVQEKQEMGELRAALKERGSWLGDIQATRSSGVSFVAQCIAHEVRDRHGKPLCIMVSCIDVTDRKRLEEERLLLTKLEATGVLAAGIAHDFNNLLMVILGRLELLGEPGEDPAPHRAAAIQAALEARGLTQQFLTFAKGGRPVRKVLALAGVLQDAVTLTLRGAPVACDFALPDDLWAVEGDATQLGRVVQNLVLNAREAMPSGGRIAIRAENVAGPPPTLRVRIVDSGRGIPADILPRVFDPYFSTKERGGQRGTGLGLTVCRAIVEQHGGTLTVESAVGVGTTAQIVLPATAATPGASGPAPIPQAGTGRLLLMDDEETVRITVATLLRHLGYTVELAAHGEEAVALYQAAQARGERFDAVLLDLTVRGGFGGLPALQALRRLDPAVTAVMVSGYADDPVLVDPARFGFHGALAKPYGIAALGELLARVLGR